MKNLLSELFLFTLNKSMIVLAMILIVLAIRLVFRQMPKKYLCVLWMMVFLRLIMSEYTSAISLNPFHENNLVYDKVYVYRGTEGQSDAEGDVRAYHTYYMNSGIEGLDRQFNRLFLFRLYEQKAGGNDSLSGEELHGSQTDPVEMTESVNLFRVLSTVWFLVAAALLFYSGCRVFLLKKRLSTAVIVTAAGERSFVDERMQRRFEKKHFRIYESDRVESPFLLGFFKPVIYLPLDFLKKNDSDSEYALLHEKMHIVRRDHMVKPILFVIACFYWYHPLVWLSFFLFSKDVEMAVDEAVCLNQNKDMRTDYAQALFRLSIKQSGLYLPLAFGESHTKERVKHILSWSRGGKWITAATVILIAVVFFVFGGSNGRAQGAGDDVVPAPGGAGTFSSGGADDIVTGDEDDASSSMEPNESDEAKFDAKESQLMIMAYHISKDGETIDQYDLLYTDGVEWKRPLAFTKDCRFSVIEEDSSYAEYKPDEWKSMLKTYEEIGVLCDVTLTGGAISDIRAEEPVFLLDEILRDRAVTEKITYYEDLTGDGVKERIEVDPLYVNRMTRTGEEKTVTVYSGATGKELWSGHADYVHVGWIGYYVYRNDTGAYLLEWEPGMWQGAAVYTFRIFSLDETGQEKELVSDEIEFDINVPESCDVDEIRSFAERVNDYFKDSYVLVDTNDSLNMYGDINWVNVVDVDDLIEWIEENRNE